MPYSPKLKQSVNNAPKTLGSILGRWAIDRDLSVTRIAFATGATRQTIYNWFAGGEVTPAYRDRVTLLVKALSTSGNTDVWRHVCNVFNIRG